MLPNWGVYMMFAASAIGAFLLLCELKRRGWPDPFKGV